LIGGPSPVLVRRPLAELGQRHEAAVLRLGGEPAPLRQAQVAHVRHRPWRRAAQHIPQHQVDHPRPARLADDEGLALGEQLDRIAVRPHQVVRPVGPEAFE